MNLTKFLPPKPFHVLERERLTTKLLSWEDKKLMIIHAQAGQGKSTLAAGYAQSLRTPTVWYNMDQEDDNPALFLSCLGQAVQRAFPRSLPKLPPVPQDHYGIGGIRQNISRWIEQVFASLPHPTLIVFDDFNTTSSAVLQLLLKALIDTTPHHVRFMLISRVQPELGIARLRATQSVGELIGDDLRFSDAEVQDLFNIIFRMQVSENEAALINSTAEGWPAGLVLMHEYLSTLTPSARALAIVDRRSTGFRTHVFDYLAQEVFAHLPTDMQRFLLQTSIVDHLPVPLIGLLTGLPRTTSSSRTTSITKMVQDLRTRNLFVAAMDDDASVIRYHALFREFLRKKLITQTRPMDVKKLYTIAAAYFKKIGDPVRSVDLSLASGQFDQAVKQIEIRGEEMIACGQTQTLIRWIETLPVEYGNRPWFLFYRAVACRFTDPRTALTFFDLALKGFRSNKAALHRTSGMMHSLCGIIEACFHTGGDFTRMGRTAALANALLKRSGRESPEARARLLLTMGMAWFFIGRLQQGSEALKQALDLFRKQGDYFYQITSAIYLTPCALYQGDFRVARDAVHKGFEAHASIPDEAGSEAALFLTKAMTALFEGCFAEAQTCIDQCRTLADIHALESISFLSLDIGGWLKIAQGDYSGAEILLTECKRKGEESQNAFFSASAAHLLAISYMFQRKLDRAKSESDYALAIRTQSGSRLFHAIYLIASGAIYLKLGKLRRAEAELHTALTMLRQIRAVQQEANAHLMLALLNEKKKKPDIARKHLAEGFSIGRERGFTYYALFDAAELIELAKTALEHGICADYCSRLIDDRAHGNAAPFLKVHCLGGFKVVRNQAVVRDSQWKSARAKTFVKVLVAQDSHTISRDMAMEILWPDAPQDSLRQTFNSMLHRVRKVLEPENRLGETRSCILHKEGVIELNKDLVWTDVGQFISHLDTTGRMKSSQKSEKVLEEYEKALELYHGDFLPDDLYSDWAGPVRDRLRTRYLRALDDAAGIAESSGDRDRALRFHEKLFSADPCNERACCWLMTRYQSDGRRGEAIRTYERCERALSNDVDLEPEEETLTLYKSIIEG